MKANQDHTNDSLTRAPQFQFVTCGVDEPSIPTYRVLQQSRPALFIDLPQRDSIDQQRKNHSSLIFQPTENLKQGNLKAIRATRELGRSHA